MHVLHATAPGDYGGLESVLLSLAAAQRDAGMTVSMVVIVDESGDPPNAFLNALAERDFEPLLIRCGPRAYRYQYKLFAEHCRELQPDVVHTHSYHPNVLLASSARGAGFKTVSTVHGFCGGDWKNRLYEALDKFFLRFMDAVAVVSKAQIPVLTRAGVDEARIRFIANAWTPAGDLLDRGTARHELGLPDNDIPLLGFVGRLGQEKGVDILLQALAQPEARDACLAIAGDGPEKAMLRQQAESLGLTDRIHWLGSVNGAWRYFAAFDALVLPSRTEGTPMCLLEAMHAGTPIIASAVGGVPDVIGADSTSGEAGLLVPPESPEALAGAIAATLQQPEAVEARVGAARQRLAEQYDVAQWETRYRGLYEAATTR